MKSLLRGIQPEPVYVTTFAVVWIEIMDNLYLALEDAVTTFAVVWIEIASRSKISIAASGHHLRGGVD